MILRSAEPKDFGEVFRLIFHAFGRSNEAVLVDDLRRDGAMAVEGVAVAGGTIVGYAGFSHMASPPGTLGLGPIATVTAYRRQGVAGSLIRWGIGEAERRRFCGLFVLGDPALYGRFGFDLTRAAGFRSPYAGPHFMALALDTEFPAVGDVDYAPAFQRFGR